MQAMNHGRYVAGCHVMVIVVFVDDQALVCKGLQRLLEHESDMQVIGECEDGDQVVSGTRAKHCSNRHGLPSMAATR